jgi:predicted nucleotidyltransferase
MNSLDFLQAKRADILRVAALHGGRNVRVFGSTARGDEGPFSDVDFLIEFEEGRSVLDLAGLWQDLEELLGRKVDVAEPEGLHWYIRDRVLKEAVPL